MRHSSCARILGKLEIGGVNTLFFASNTIQAAAVAGIKIMSHIPHWTLVARLSTLAHACH